MSTEIAFENLANAVVVRAVEDWRYLCAKGRPNSAFAGLRAFFEGDWCAFLCGALEPEMILEKLEEERRAAINN